MTDFSSLRWDKHVQSGLEDRYLSSSYCYLAAGPPRLSLLGGTSSFASMLNSRKPMNRVVYPLGMTQSHNIVSNKAFLRVFEVGSRRSLWLPGHAMQQLMLNRVYVYGASLLRVLYAYYSDLLGDVQVLPIFDTIVAPPNKHDVLVSPGYENVFLAMCSDLFDQQFGLLFYIRDSENATFGAFYLEGAVAPSHNWLTDSAGNAITESVVVQFEWVQPVQANQIALVTE